MHSSELPHHVSLVHMFAAAVAAQPGRIAVVCGDDEITYAQMQSGVVGLANHLCTLGAQGGRVVVMMANSVAMDIALMAVLAAQAQAAPVNPFFTDEEIAPLLALSEPTVFICDAVSTDKARRAAAAKGIQHVVEIGDAGLSLKSWYGQTELTIGEQHLPQADATALLVFTGGTTGVPKGVEHTHAALMHSQVMHATIWPLEYGAETFLNVAPMFHVWGLVYATWMPIYAQSTLIIIPKYEPDVVVAALGRHHVTVFAGGPAPIYLGLLDSPLLATTDCSHLKYCLSGGAPCPDDLHRRWPQLTGCVIFEGYGMSEGAPICNMAVGITVKARSVGPPVPNTEVRIVDLETGSHELPSGDAGEICVRGPQFTHGYLKRPEESAQLVRDGWLYTGDIGYLDEDNYLFIVDRKKEMVIVGGYNVYPRQVDDMLFEHPKIKEAATVGKSHDRLGEVLVAFVVLQDGIAMDEVEFFDYCKTTMVKYKRPVEVTFVDALPRTGARKIDKKLLRTHV